MSSRAQRRRHRKARNVGRMRERRITELDARAPWTSLADALDAEVRAASALHQAFVENLPAFERTLGEPSLPDGGYIPPKGIEPGLTREEIELHLNRFNPLGERRYRQEILGTFTVELTQEMIDRTTAKPEAFVDFAQRMCDGG